jgi:putative ABC transport system permease protein
VLRGITGAGGMIARRRAKRDLAILLVWTALVGFTTLLAVAGPRLLLNTVDQGARAAVAAAGSRADIVVQTGVGGLEQDSPVPLTGAGGILNLARKLPVRLPKDVARVYAGMAVTVLGRPTRMTVLDGTAIPITKNVQIQLGMLTPANAKTLAVVDGKLPPARSDTVDVVLGAAAASAAGLHVGSTMEVVGLPGPSESTPPPKIGMRVVGIVKPVQAAGAAAAWQDTPNLWTPLVAPAADASAPIGITVLATPAAMASTLSAYNEDFDGQIRLRLNPAAFTSALESTVEHELTGLAANTQVLSRDPNIQLTVNTKFSDALAGFRAQARAALAQMSVMIAGVLGVAAAVVILLSRLLVLRRVGELALERARGASLASIGARALAESVAASIVGAAVGIGAAWLVIPGPVGSPLLLVAVLLIAVVAAPVQAVIQARAVWTGRRVPANRLERVALEKRTRGRRLAAEATLVVLAVGAIFSLSTRGLLQTRTDGVDPFLASAPLLFAIVVTILVLHVYPWPVRLIGSLGRRTAGVLGLLGAVRAERAARLLPLLALTLAVALTVGGSLLIETVRAGQAAASWQRIGADVRVEGQVTPSKVADVAGESGVTAAGSALVTTGVQMELGTTTGFATMLAIDRRFPDAAGSQPGASDSASLRKLARDTAPTAALPVVVDTALARDLVTGNIALYYGLKKLPLHVVGTTDLTPTGYLSGPFIYVDLASLSERMSESLTARTLLIVGPGARHAAADLHVPRASIHSRATWLDQRRHLPLVAGVTNTMTLATAAVALLAMIGLIATVLAGARERGRSLSLLRTLGMRARLGWWLALAELAPVVIAALLGGIVAGVGMVLVLAPSMGLDELAGGLSAPPPTVSPAVFIWLVGAAVVLLGCAVLAEVVAHRRDRLSEVLRVGETV